MGTASDLKYIFGRVTCKLWTQEHTGRTKHSVQPACEWSRSCRMLANVLFPNWLVTMLLLGLLIFLTYKTVRKAWSLHRSEVRYLAQQDEQQRHRPATSEEAVSAANGPALHVPNRAERMSAEKSNCNKGCAATAKGAAGQAGAPVGESEMGDQAQGQDDPSLLKEVNRPAPSRQCASLEVEGLPNRTPSGE